MGKDNREIQFNSNFFYCAFHKTHCFKADLQKVHFRNVHRKIQLVNHIALTALSRLITDNEMTIQ